MFTKVTKATVLNQIFYFAYRSHIIKWDRCHSGDLLNSPFYAFLKHPLSNKSVTFLSLFQDETKLLVNDPITISARVRWAQTKLIEVTALGKSESKQNRKYTNPAHQHSWLLLKQKMRALLLQRGIHVVSSSLKTFMSQIGELYSSFAMALDLSTHCLEVHRSFFLSSSVDLPFQDSNDHGLILKCIKTVSPRDFLTTEYDWTLIKKVLCVSGLSNLKVKIEEVMMCFGWRPYPYSFNAI